MLSSILSAQSHSASTLCQASSGRAMRIFLIAPLGLAFALSLSVFIDFIIVHSIVGFDPSLLLDFSVLDLSPCFDCSIGRSLVRCFMCCCRLLLSRLRGRYSLCSDLLRWKLCLRRTHNELCHRLLPRFRLPQLVELLGRKFCQPLVHQSCLPSDP